METFVIDKYIPSFTKDEFILQGKLTPIKDCKWKAFIDCATNREASYVYPACKKLHTSPDELHLQNSLYYITMLEIQTHQDKSKLFADFTSKEFTRSALNSYTCNKDLKEINVESTIYDASFHFADSQDTLTKILMPNAVNCVFNFKEPHSKLQKIKTGKNCNIIFDYQGRFSCMDLMELPTELNKLELTSVDINKYNNPIEINVKTDVTLMNCNFLSAIPISFKADIIDIIGGVNHERSKGHLYAKKYIRLYSQPNHQHIHYINTPELHIKFTGEDKESLKNVYIYHINTLENCPSIRHYSSPGDVIIIIDELILTHSHEFIITQGNYMNYHHKTFIINKIKNKFDNSNYINFLAPPGYNLITQQKVFNTDGQREVTIDFSKDNNMKVNFSNIHTILEKYLQGGHKV